MKFVEIAAPIEAPTPTAPPATATEATSTDDTIVESSLASISRSSPALIVLASTNALLFVLTTLKDTAPASLTATPIRPAPTASEAAAAMALIVGLLNDRLLPVFSMMNVLPARSTACHATPSSRLEIRTSPMMI